MSSCIFDLELRAFVFLSCLSRHLKPGEADSFWGTGIRAHGERSPGFADARVKSPRSPDPFFDLARRVFGSLGLPSASLGLGFCPRSSIAPFAMFLRTTVRFLDFAVDPGFSWIVFPFLKTHILGFLAPTFFRRRAMDPPPPYYQRK